MSLLLFPAMPALIAHKVIEFYWYMGTHGPREETEERSELTVTVPAENTTMLRPNSYSTLLLILLGVREHVCMAGAQGSGSTAA
jgi:hypothetical protein